MTLGGILETFDARKTPSASRAAQAQIDRDAQIKAVGFEEGYASGWEDAKTAEEAARQRVAAEFERNVEAISFSYHEAVEAVRSELDGFLEAFVTSFLPEIVPDLTAAFLRDELRQIGMGAVPTNLEIVVSSSEAPFLQGLLSDHKALDMALVEDGSLAPHQVFVRSEQQERCIDLSPLISALQEQLAAIHQVPSNQVDDPESDDA